MTNEGLSVLEQTVKNTSDKRENIVVFSDRDGTITKDENYYLGSNPQWKDQVSFLEGVVPGIGLINNIPDSYFFILTNQSGVALKGERFDELTLERMHEVNRYVIDRLEEQGLKIDDYFACPFVDLDYVEKARKKEREINEEFIRDGHPDLKPKTGMIKRALESIPLSRENCRIFMIGDRASDVEMGLNANGVGILIESYKTKELGDKEKIPRLGGTTYIADDFLDAAIYIKRGIFSGP